MTCIKGIVILVVSLLASCYTGKDVSTNDGNSLLFEEQFNGESLNEDIWTMETGDGCPNCGWGNRESQIYTENNHHLKDGFLIITAKREDSVYTSTRIKTQDKFEFQYGTIEMRAKLPTGKGTWPAFWMLGSNIDKVGWPLCGEIDIMEYAGKDRGLIHTTLHTEERHGASPNTSRQTISGIENGFHTYKATWTEEQIEFFIDDRSVYTFSPSNQKDEKSWPFDQPFFILINFAVGGHFGGFDIDESVFPQEYIIDYVKVWKEETG